MLLRAAALKFPHAAKWLPVGAAYRVYGALLGAARYAALGRPVERRVQV